MQKHAKKVTIIFFLSLFLIIIPTITSQSPNPTTVQGYVYINGEKITPDEVSLMLPDEMRYAYILEDGKYQIVFTRSEQMTGTFLVIYQNKNYDGGSITMPEGLYFYEKDLYITTEPDDEPPPDTDPATNQQPKAKAGGPYYKTVNIPVEFDASESYDNDGAITNYQWDFGDGTIGLGISPSHKYHLVGDYRVKLTVTDDKEKTDLDITYAYITETPNNPPSKPIINGSFSGSVNSRYNYSILSTDIENNTIQYLIDWDDETDSTVTDLLQNGTTYQLNHSWTYPGIYRIKGYAIDEKDTVSQPTEQVILIDSVFCDNIGYMIDYTNDSIYELFHSNITREETPVELVNELYLIDDDNDGYPDYQYNTTTAETSEYIFQIPTAKRTPTFFETIQPYIPHILIIVLAALIASIPVLIYKIRKTPKKKVKKVKEKKKAEKTVSKSEDKSIDDRIKDIEEQVDELPSKKKS